MTVFEKLKHEWKTFALAVAVSAGGLYDAAVKAGYDLTPLVPEKYRSYIVPIVGIAFLALRQWKPKKDEDVFDK